MVEHLSELPPGPDLSAALAVVDRSSLDDHDLIALAQARTRQIAHEQAELLADLVAIGPFDDLHLPPQLADTAFDCAAVQIAAALCWTRRAAQGWLGLARDAVRRLPDLHAALLAGVVDLPRVRVFTDELATVDDRVATAVVGRLLPDVSAWTTGQLRGRIRKLVLAADPAAAADRYRVGVAGRRVACYPDTDGTAALLGQQLPADQATAAMERLDGFAKAAKCAGDPRSMDQLRADVFLGLLTGTYDGPAPVHRAGVVELTVPLTTLAGLAEAPGELAGYGPVAADIARRIATGHHNTTWRYTVLDEDGRVVAHGITRRRPTTGAAAFVRARDRHCVFPGCRVPASRCDLDHRIRHSDGGPSTVDNMQVLCRRHHRSKDEYGWQNETLPGGGYRWTSPAGHTYTVPPHPFEDTLIRAGPSGTCPRS